MADVIDWDKVRERWASKLQHLENRPALVLPYASASSLVLSGSSGGRDRQLAIEWLVQTHPDEIPLDLAPAKCRAIDEEFFEKARALQILNRSITQMEAQLLATDEALYYVTPDLENMYVRWPWTETSLKIRRRRTFAKALVATHRKKYEIGLGSCAAANFQAIYRWATAPPRRGS